MIKVENSSTSLHALPKAEVHIHLEGCIEPATLEGWARQDGVPMPRPREQLFALDNLGDILKFLDWACGLATTKDRLTEMAYGFCRRLAADGTGYADLIINPTHWAAQHGRTKDLIDALDSGFTAALQDGLPPVGLCISLLRTQSSDEAIELVENLTAWRHPRVVALSVDGNEAATGRTGQRFAEAYRRAGNAGLRRTVHAGESSGPEGVRDAVEFLGADRIDHGVRAIEDDRVVALLVERGIPLGICPTSNLATNLYPSIEAHPIDRLRQAGVKVSINTDDPSLYGIDLPTEYGLVATAFGWSDEVLRDVARTSIDASFANAGVKASLKSSLIDWRSQPPAALRSAKDTYVWNQNDTNPPGQGKGSFIVTTHGTMAGFFTIDGSNKKYTWEGKRISKGPQSPKAEPKQGGVKVTEYTTGYDAPGGNDKCYLNPGETASVLGADKDDPTWKHLQGAGACDGEDFWVYDDGVLENL